MSYVHYRWEGYQRFGLEHSRKDITSGSGVDWNKVYNQQKTNIQSLVGSLSSTNKAMVESIVDGLNLKLALVRDWQSGRSSSSANKAEAQKWASELQKELEKEFFKGANAGKEAAMTLDPGRMQAYNKNNSTETIKGISENRSTTASRIKKDWESLRNNASLLCQTNNLSLLPQIMKSMKDEYDNLIDEIENYRTLSGEKTKGHIFFDKMTKGEDVRSFARKINNLNRYILEALGGTGGNANIYKGLANELAIAKMTSELVYNNATKAIVKSVEVLGDTKNTKSAFDLNNLSLTEQAMLNNSRRGSYVKVKNFSAAKVGDFFATANATQQKIDILITYDNPFNDSELAPLSISAKNVNPYTKEIGVLTGSSVFQLLHQDNEFLYHYLNIAPKREPSKDTAPNELREAFHNIAKATILARAISGSSYRITETGVPYDQRTNALFIVDSTKGVYAGYAMSDILKQISENVSFWPAIKTGDFDNALSSLVNRRLGSPVINDRLLGEKRVMNILAELHAMKLDVSLAPALLKKVTPIAGSFM